MFPFSGKLNFKNKKKRKNIYKWKNENLILKIQAFPHELYNIILL